MAEFPLNVVTEIEATQRWRGGGADVHSGAAVRGGAASLSRGGKDAPTGGPCQTLTQLQGIDILDFHLRLPQSRCGLDDWYKFMAENWTDLAPPPPSLEQGKTWHIFVSYRSVNRPWVLALYDILNGLGYKAFLDQYVLTAAAPLAISLGEAFDASQSAVLVWSGK